MKVGDRVRTSSLPVKAYSQSNTSSTLVAEFSPVSQNFGTVIERITSWFGPTWLRVKLDEPIVKGAITYNNVYVYEAGVWSSNTAMANYYVNSKAKKVNFRSAASTVTGRVLTVLSTGELVGSGDGTVKNGFLFITRPDKSTGWISRAYVTTAAPVGAGNTTPGTGTTSGSGTDAGTGTSGGTASDTPTPTQTIEIKLENLVGDKAAPVVKWGLIALGVAIVALFAVRLIKHKGGKPARKR